MIKTIPVAPYRHGRHGMNLNNSLNTLGTFRYRLSRILSYLVFREWLANTPAGQLLNINPYPTRAEILQDVFNIPRAGGRGWSSTWFSLLPQRGLVKLIRSKTIRYELTDISRSLISDLPPMDVIVERYRHLIFT